MRRMMQNQLNAVADDAGNYIGRVYTACTAYTNTTAAIMASGARPQNTDGVELLTAVFTPTTTANRIRARGTANVWAAANGDAVLALFHSSSSLAIQAAVMTVQANQGSVIPFEYETTVTSTVSQSFAVRVGDGGDGNTIYFNGDSTANFFSGIIRHTLIIEEIEP